MKQLFTFFLFIFISSISSAQTVITGHVQDSKGKTVESFVTLSTKSSGTTESYADVDARVSINWSIQAKLIHLY